MAILRTAHACATSIRISIFVCDVQIEKVARLIFRGGDVLKRWASDSRQSIWLLSLDSMEPALKKTLISLAGKLTPLLPSNTSKDEQVMHLAR